MLDAYIFGIAQHAGSPFYGHTEATSGKRDPGDRIRLGGSTIIAGDLISTNIMVESYWTTLDHWVRSR